MDRDGPARRVVLFPPTGLRDRAMTTTRILAFGLILASLGACAPPPPPLAQVDETRPQRPIRDAKTELERGARR